MESEAREEQEEEKVEEKKLASTSGDETPAASTPASTWTSSLQPLLPPPPSPPCYTVAATPYTGEPAARGLVANRRIRRGEAVETAHCVVLEDYPAEAEGEKEKEERKNENPEENGNAASSCSSPVKGQKNPTMGLEHYVFFDRRGRSSCSAPSSSSGREGGRRSNGGDDDDDGGGEGGEEEAKAEAPLPSLRVLLALGVGSLFNHSARPNVDWRAGTVGSSGAPLVERQGARAKEGRWSEKGRQQGEKQTTLSSPSPSSPLWPVIAFIAARDIEPGEELTISYGQPWWEEEEEDEEESEEEGEEERKGGGNGGSGKGRELEKKLHRRKKKPTHSHMDDEEAFLGAMTLGGGE